MAILLNNKILQSAEAELESKLLPDVKDDYMRIVVAGMRAALHGGAGGSLLVERLQRSKDPLTDIAKGAVNLVVALSHQSQGVMPMKAMVPASMTLMLQALDFADKAKVITVGAAELVKATHIWSNRVMTVFHITPAMVNKAADMAHGVMKDPTQMEAINRRAGVVKDPRAGVPTELPMEGKTGQVQRQNGNSSMFK